MALFKISKGLKENLPAEKTAGFCWYTINDSLFYIDYEDENGVVQRQALNAKDTETLTGASLSTILNASDIEIPTSAAVLNAIAGTIPLKITLTADGENFTADKSFAEITTAYNNGRTVYLAYKNSVYPLTLVRTNRVAFELNEETGRKQIQCRHYSDADTWEYTETPQTQADWSETYEDSASYIRNKPFGDFYAIRRTGDETTTVTGKYTTFTLVSTEVLEYAELSGVALYAGSGGSFPSLTRFSDNAYGNYNGILVITQDGTTCSQVSNNPFPKAGIYLGAETEYAVLQYKKIPEKYIPSKFETTDSVQAKIDEATADLATTEYVDSKQTQSDWTVNDATNPAYIKNRPFYITDPQAVSVLNEITLAKEDFSEYDNTLYHEISLNMELVEDLQYTVVINGTVYTLFPKNHNGQLYFGNYNIENTSAESSGESYCITSSYFDIYNDENVSASYTISITAMISEYIQIDKKFIQCKPGEVLQAGETRNVYLGYSQEYVDVTIGKNAEIFNSDSNVASGWNSHAEGEETKALGNCSHAEGNGTEATSAFAHAEGSTTHATAAASHAEGNSSIASGHYSHAEGSGTIASGRISHAEGDGAEALEWASHAEGCLTIAASPKQHAQGQYNIADSASKYAHIVGNGTSYNRRSNAHTLDWSGNAWFAGEVKIGGTGQDDASAKTLATKEYVDSKAGGSWEVLMDVTVEEECVEVIGITLTAEQKEKIANGGDFVCYAECPPPTTTASTGWICGGLWANNMYYFILSGFGQPSGIVPASTDTHTSKIYSNLKNASGDMRIRDMLCATIGESYQVKDFMDTSAFMMHYQTQPMSVRFKTNGVFAAGTRLVCKVR